MLDNTVRFHDKITLKELLEKCSSMVINSDTKGTYAKKLIKLLLTEECHKHKNRAYELPKDFCYIFYTCLNLKKKSNINSKTGKVIDKRKIPDEPYDKVHRFFLHCSQGKWAKISFFDISDTFAILSTCDTLSEDLRKHLQDMRELLTALDNLEYRYPHLYSNIFSSNSDASLFKKNILLSLCRSDKKKFLINNGIYTKRNKIYELLNNPYRS